MRISNALIITLLVLSMFSCGDRNLTDDQLFGIETNVPKKGQSSAVPLELKVVSKKGKTVQSVVYAIDGAEKGSSEGNNNITIDVSEEKLGKRTITATIQSEEGTHTVNKTVTLLAPEKATLYTYEVLESYPHDMKAYTQGLEFENDTLYESTGKYKASSLRKTNYQTGEVYQNIPLGDTYFGEGLTILNDKIYQLTWQNKTGFIYDLASMEKKGTFVYGSSQEGWGLCNDGNKIYKSDGTERIYTLNNNTLAEEGHIEIYTHASRIPKVNELEWVDGKIYANIYQKGAIAIVNPANGAVDGVIDLNSLKEQVTQHEELDVLNGIAYNGEPGILYVTGKNWDKLFKIRVVPK